MGQVSVFINGRSYRLGCEDGQEKRVLELARHVATKVDELLRDVGPIGGERLYVMAALMLADEVQELREGLRQAVSQQAAALKEIVPEAATALAPAPSIPAAPAHSKPAAKAKSPLQVPGAERGVAQSVRG